MPQLVNTVTPYMRNVIIVGRRQEGKTTLAVFLALASSKGVVAFDINGQIEIEGSQYVCDVEGFLELMTTPVSHRPRVIIYRPVGRTSAGNNDTTSLDDEFQQVASILWDAGYNYAFIVDESHWLQRPISAHPMIEQYVRMADSSVLFIQTTHTLSDSWARGRSLASDIIMFRLTRRADLKAIETEFGEEVSAQVRELPKHHYVRVDLDNHTSAIVDNPDSWFVSKHEQEREGVVNA